MEEWLGNVATVATPLIAIAALIVSIWASRRVARKREFEILLERIDREAAKREAETREFMQRIEREAAKRDELFEKAAAKRDELFEKAAAERNERFEKAAAERDELFKKAAAERDERFDREAERREAAIRMLIDRSDSKFDTLLARSDELFRQSAEVTGRVARTEGILDTVQADRHQAPATSAAASGESEAIAAQGVAGERAAK